MVNYLEKPVYIITGFIAVIFPFYAHAQVFTGAGGPIQNNGVDTYFNITVPGITQVQLDSIFGIEEVCIDINHTSVENLYIFLQSPAGKMVQLAAGSSNNGANYTNTCFNSSADTSVTLANAPYTGLYKPIGYLGRFNDGQIGNGVWKLIVRDYIASPDSGYVISWSIKFGNNPSKPVILTSSNLPIVFINTNGQAISGNEITVSMGIVFNGNQRNYTTDSWNEYNGKTRINTRGHTSKNYEKKSYTLELRDTWGEEIEASLLGMPSESDWCLIASYADKSLLRNQVTYDLYREMGHYSPRTKNVEVIINNEYQGVYALLEKPKRDNDRIDISRVNATDNFYPEITGGYIIKIDRPDEDGWNSLLEGNSSGNAHFYYQYVYPKDTAITTSQKNYIKDFMDSLETTINSSYYSSPTEGYQKYINTPSFIDFFIINELSKNIDAYRLSTYLCKDNINKGGKLSIGPVWDYDLAWHNCNYGNAFAPAGWEYLLPDTDFPSPAWWGRFMDDSNFTNLLSCRWNELRQSIINTNYLNNYIDSNAALLDEAQQRNFIQWPVIKSYIFPNPQAQSATSYQNEVNDIKNWIASRISWLDANISVICQTVNTNEQLAFAPTMNCFPNPFTDNLNVSYKITGAAAKVKMELFSMLGKPVQLLYSGTRQAGIYEEKMNTNQLAAGIYIVRLSVDNHIVYKKIIKAG